MSGLMIRPVTLSDAEAIAGIYSYYITNTVVTFETAAVDAAAIRSRITDIVAEYPYLVAELDSRVIGFSYIGPWKARAAFLHSGESSVYMHPDHTGHGHGKTLYTAVLRKATAYNLHCIISGITLPNQASEALHRSLGFHSVGVMKNIGFKFNRFLDIAYYQLLMDITA